MNLRQSVHRKRTGIAIGWTAALTLVGAAYGVSATEQGGHHLPGTTAAVPGLIDPAPLLLSDGKSTSLKDIARRHRVTIVSITFTGCRSICPTSDLLMNAVDDTAASNGITDVGLATLSIDPFNDTPGALARRAAEIGSSRRRAWLTGAPAAVFTVLDGLGVKFGRIDDHTSVFFITNREGSTTIRVDGLPDPEWLLATARRLK